MNETRQLPWTPPQIWEDTVANAQTAGILSTRLYFKRGFKVVRKGQNYFHTFDRYKGSDEVLLTLNRYKGKDRVLMIFPRDEKGLGKTEITETLKEYENLELDLPEKENSTWYCVIHETSKERVHEREESILRKLIAIEAGDLVQKSKAPRDGVVLHDGVVLRTGVVLEGGFDALEAVLEKREIEKKVKEEEKGEREEAKRKEGEKKDEEDSDVHPNGKPESGTESISDDEAEDLVAKDDDDCIPESISNDDSMEVDGTEPVESGKRKIPIVGLENWGNDCFFNAAFQCLVHTRLLTDYVLKKLKGWREITSDKDEKKLNWSVGVGNLMDLMCEPNRNSFFISAAKNVLMYNLEDSETLMPGYEKGDQADAFDCFNAMLRGMHESFPTKDTIIPDTFKYELCEKTSCQKCKKDIKTNESNSMDLNFLCKEKTTSLEDELDGFLGVIKRTTCNTCKKGEVITTNNIVKEPEVLQIVLRRESGERNTIQFPLSSLDIGKYLSPSGDDNGSKKKAMYDLYAVMVHKDYHKDMADCGHYYAYVKSEHDIWHRINDNCVEKVEDADEVEKAQAYVLLYKKVDSVDPNAGANTMDEANEVPIEGLDIVHSMEEDDDDEQEEANVAVPNDGMEVDGTESSLDDEAEEEEESDDDDDDEDKKATFYQIDQL